jgi:hypothetical protein
MEVDEKSEQRAPLSATAALKQTTQILSSTTKTTKAVLTTFADTKWWQSTIKTLKQPTKRQISETVVYDNDKFEKQGCIYTPSIESFQVIIQTQVYFYIRFSIMFSWIVKTHLVIHDKWYTQITQ